MRGLVSVWKKSGGIFDVANKEEEFKILEAKAASPEFWDNPDKARTIIAKTNQLRAILKPFGELSEIVDELEMMLEIATEEEGAEQEKSLNEASKIVAQAEEMFAALELKSLLNGKLDANNAYLTLHAGAGGTESCDWADMLFRMYRRYCERNNFDCEIVDYLPGEEAGIKSVTFLVKGDFAYGYMKAERGVHRLVRISPFDSNKRRHTSFAALDVVAEIDDDVDVEMADSDLRIDTYRASGAGGQHINKTDSAVRITHLPTGIVVACQSERSQHKNRAYAMKLLRAKIYEYRMDQKRQDLEKFYGQKGEIAWGSQIRSYVMQPYTMVKDHRTNCEYSNITAVLDGDIQRFIEAYLKKLATDKQ